jgi:hypothetical protein
MVFSPHDPGTLLVAANRLFKSTDRGDSWMAISPDLTARISRDTIVTMGVRGSDLNIAANDGIGTFGTIVTIAESPAQAGVYYTGADDGTLSVSRNGGQTWTNITANLTGGPRGGFVSDVVPSKYAAGTVYVSVDNHLLNDYAPHIWVSCYVATAGSPRRCAWLNRSGRLIVSPIRGASRPSINDASQKEPPDE